MSFNVLCLTLLGIHTLLPAIMERWEEIPFDKRVRFVGALVDKVLLSLEAPSCRVCLKMP